MPILAVIQAQWKKKQLFTTQNSLQELHSTSNLKEFLINADYGISPRTKISYSYSKKKTEHSNLMAGFGGDVVRCSGCWDYPYKEEQYPIFANSQEFNNFFNVCCN